MMDALTIVTALGLGAPALGWCVKLATEQAAIKARQEMLEKQTSDNSQRIADGSQSLTATATTVATLKEAIIRNEAWQQAVLTKLDQIRECVVPRDEIDRRFAEAERQRQQVQANVEFLERFKVAGSVNGD